MTEPTPAADRAPLFDRVVFASLVPSLLLPVIAAVAAVVGVLTREAHGADGEGIAALVVAVYLFVLLGSMTLNGWLLLRHPQSLLTAALPRRASVAVAVLEALLVVWIVLLAFGVIGALGVGFGAVLAVVSIVVFVIAVARHARPGEVPRIADAALPTWGRVTLVAYIAVAVIALGAAIAAPALAPGWSDAAGALGGAPTWALLVLGLPWSHPLYFASVALLFWVSETPVVPTVLVALAVVANIAIASVLLGSPARRTAIANWFFRLGRGAAAPTVQAPPVPGE